MTTNEMTLAKAFRDAGIEQDRAEHLSQEIFNATRDNVATKADLVELGRETTSVYMEPSREMYRMELRLIGIHDRWSLVRRPGPVAV